MDGLKPLDGISVQFPVGPLTVVVVDADNNCVNFWEKKSIKYEVATFSQGDEALHHIKGNKDRIDFVLIALNMLLMNFELLENIKSEMELPVTMTSYADRMHVVLNGLRLGGRDYLKKPVSTEMLEKIWYHLLFDKSMTGTDFKHSGTEDNQKLMDDVGCSPLAIEEGSRQRSCKRSRDGDIDEPEEIDDSSPMKKKRLAWSSDLRDRFEAAVNEHGIDNAVPKKILKSMKVDGLTREQVASHLQKYRLNLKKKHEGVVVNSNNMGRSNASSLALPSQSLAAYGHIPQHDHPSQISTETFVPPYPNPNMPYVNNQINYIVNNNIGQVNLNRRLPVRNPLRPVHNNIMSHPSTHMVRPRNLCHDNQVNNFNRRSQNEIRSQNFQFGSTLDGSHHVPEGYSTVNNQINSSDNPVPSCQNDNPHHGS